MNFKQWVKLIENGTSTANVATFSRPLMGIIRRDDFLPQEKVKKGKKKHRASEKQYFC